MYTTAPAPVVYLICIHAFDVNLVGQPILFCFNDIIFIGVVFGEVQYLSGSDSFQVGHLDTEDKASLKYDVKGVEWEYSEYMYAGDTGDIMSVSQMP